MSEGELVAAGTAGSDIEHNSQAPAKLFGIIDIPDVTIPQIIQAIIDGLPLEWPADQEAQEAAILSRMAKATSEQALFGEQQATSWGQLLDVPMEVHGYRLLPSSMENSIAFAVVDAYSLAEGEQIVVTTSAKGVLIQLLQGTLLGLVPGVFKLVEVGQETKGRSRPQRLLRLGDLVDPSTAA